MATLPGMHPMHSQQVQMQPGMQEHGFFDHMQAGPSMNAGPSSAPVISHQMAEPPPRAVASTAYVRACAQPHNALRGGRCSAPTPSLPATCAVCLGWHGAVTCKAAWQPDTLLGCWTHACSLLARAPTRGTRIDSTSIKFISALVFFSHCSIMVSRVPGVHTFECKCIW
jgi:hypothetical protein